MTQNAPSLEELEAQILISPVPDLEPHIKRGAFIVIHEELNLAHTAQLIAANDEATITDYIAKGWLYRASEKDIPTWKHDKSFFHFIIVQPFVIAKKFIDLKDKTS